MFFLLIILWFIRSVKAILFYVYLWQLKEYHLGRFLAHLGTEKGKRVFSSLYDKVIFFTLVFTTSLIFYPSALMWILVVLYSLECGKGFINLFKKQLKSPVLTKKTIVLIFTALALEVFSVVILFGDFKNTFWLVSWLFVLDIATPLVVSLMVLFLQPITVLWKMRTIEKAKRKRGEFKNLVAIGITGSYGKTSTKEFLAAILSEKYKVLKTKEHQNSEIGVAQCVLNELSPEHEIFIAEMGAYNKGGIKLLCDIVKPKIGILTGINTQHLATYGSQRNIINTKFELIESLPENGTAVLNWENDLIAQNAKIKTSNRGPEFKVIKYSVSKKEDIWAENIKVGKSSISFRVFSKNRALPASPNLAPGIWTTGDFADFKVNVLGGHNILNILAATSCAKQLGMSLDQISKACGKIKQEQGPLRLVKGVDGLNVIDSTYSANPDGLIADLEYLKVWSGKKIIVFPCLIELGSSAIEAHHKIGEKIGEVCDLAIVTTKEMFKEIREGATEKGMDPQKIIFMEDPMEMFQKIKKEISEELLVEYLRNEMVVLLESRVPKDLVNLLVEK